MQCPQCQHENQEGAKFCDECGTPLAVRCPACGTENRPGAKFCTECGASFRASTSALSPSQPTQPQPDAESRFQALLSEVMALIQRDRRATYRRLKYVFAIDDALLEDLRKELTFRQVARDEQSEGLVWTGEAQSVVSPVVDDPRQPAAVPIPPSRITESSTPSHGPTIPPETTLTDAPHNDPATPLEPTQSAHEAERRQVTVMFADISGFTAMSETMDPEAVRNVMNGCFARLVPIVEAY